MKHSKTVLAVVFLMAFATAGETAFKFACNSNGRVFVVDSVTSPLNVVAMWNKSASDIDIGVFDASDEALGFGLGVVNRYETVTVGVQPLLTYFVVILKVSGPNSPCLVHIGEEAPFRAASGTRMRDLGNLQRLAEQDERYARMLEAMLTRVARKRGLTR